MITELLRELQERYEEVLGVKSYLKDPSEYLLPRKMAITIPITGEIELSLEEPLEASIIYLLRHKMFDHAANVRQLATTAYRYPGAVHTRLEHMLGTYMLARKAAEAALELVREGRVNFLDEEGKKLNELIGGDEYECFKAVALFLASLGGLLHDIAHPTFGHVLDYPVLRNALGTNTTLAFFQNIARKMSASPGYKYKNRVDSVLLSVVLLGNTSLKDAVRRAWEFYKKNWGRGCPLFEGIDSVGVEQVLYLVVLGERLWPLECGGDESGRNALLHAASSLASTVVSEWEGLRALLKRFREHDLEFFDADRVDYLVRDYHHTLAQYGIVRSDYEELLNFVKAVLGGEGRNYIRVAASS
ncbi:MAG: HD domain-containing protein, partial [Crenarchaeota archaeon]|nr:HD domain-containing protein [Thermoproteota archaeon]